MNIIKGSDMKESWITALFWIYFIGIPVTIAIIFSQEIGVIHGWRWLLAIPLDFLDGILWPGYWLAAFLDH
jgi:hypothetical protein